MAEEKKLTLEEVEKFEIKDIEELSDAQVEQLDGPMQAAIKAKIGMKNFRHLIMGEGRTKAKLAKAAAKKGLVIKNSDASQDIKVGIETEKKAPAKVNDVKPPAKKEEAPVKEEEKASE